MARQQTCAPAPPSGRTISRVVKSRGVSSIRRGSIRRRSRTLASASSSTGLQDMVSQIQLQESAAGVGGATDSRGVAANANGKASPQAKAVDGTNADGVKENTCPITDMNENPFRLFDLPTEIRLEIYRACLTRPYNILLSKPDPFHPSRMRNRKTATYPRPADEEDVSEHEYLASLLQGEVGAPEITAGQHADSTGAVGQRTLAFDETIRPGVVSRVDSSASPSSVTDSGPNIDRSRPPIRSQGSGRHFLNSELEPERPQSQDPLLSNILLASREIYKEARGILYNENRFILDINTAIRTLECLHQRSRRQIQHVELVVPGYNDILDKFQETVRLSLRYCSGLKKIVIKMPFSLPGAENGASGNTTVYANGFDILRWLPQHCDVIMEGNICTEIEEIVNRHLYLARTLDKLSYARRQLISSDTSPVGLGPANLEGCLHP